MPHIAVEYLPMSEERDLDSPISEKPSSRKVRSIFDLEARKVYRLHLGEQRLSDDGRSIIVVETGIEDFYIDKPIDFEELKRKSVVSIVIGVRIPNRSEHQHNPPTLDGITGFRLSKFGEEVLKGTVEDIKVKFPGNNDFIARMYNPFHPNHAPMDWYPEGRKNWIEALS